jgi:endonuclease/exonuclease/phosphatase family metal-dependent hydrolase
VVVRTWNVFHGNTVPPGHVNLLEDAVRLGASGDRAIVCLQELPLWALELLDDWTGMVALGAVAARTAVPRALGRSVTALNPGFFRSALTGQANAMLIAAGLRILDSSSIVLNPASFRRRLELPVASRIAWAKERRVCHAVRLALPDGRTMTAANLHATSYRRDQRLADAEVLRAAVFVDAVAAPGDVAVLAGDFNLQPERSRALGDLAGWGFSQPGPGIDHVLVRGLRVTPLVAWPLERRVVDRTVLSDHAPVEVTVG